MSFENINIKKYPKSQHNLQCLGPCYAKGTKILHPISLNITSYADHPFCPVNEWESEDPKTGKKYVMDYDKCAIPTRSKDIGNDELALNMLLPYIEFNKTSFLKVYYNVFSFEDALDWITNNTDNPINTRARIINSALSVYGKDMDIVDYRFVNFMQELIKSKYIRKIYSEISPYITVIDDTVELTTKKSQMKRLSNEDYNIERTNYIIKTFFDNESLSKFCIRYFKYRKDIWNDINNHLDNMIEDLIVYIIEKIKISQ